jgi:hypothetical protein
LERPRQVPGSAGVAEELDVETRFCVANECAFEIDPQRCGTAKASRSAA